MFIEVMSEGAFRHVVAHIFSLCSLPSDADCLIISYESCLNFSDLSASVQFRL